MKTTEMTKQVIEPTTENIQAMQHWFATLPPEQQQFAFELWKMIHRTDDSHVVAYGGARVRLGLQRSLPEQRRLIPGTSREVFAARCPCQAHFHMFSFREL